MPFSAVDEGLRFVLANPAAREAMGVADPVGLTVDQALPDLADKVCGYFEDALAGESIRVRVSGHTARDGGSHGVWIAYYIPINLADGRRIAASYAFEITDRELERASAMRERNRLKKQNEFLSTLSHGMGHDMRSPLATAITKLELVKKLHGGDLSEAARVEIDETIETLHHAAGMAGGLTRLAHAMMVPSADVVDVAEVIRASWGAIAATRDRFGPGELHVQGVVPPVMGDEDLLRDLFQNLLENAVKYRSTERDLEVRVWAVVEGDDVAVHVRDNGSGIGPDDRDRIFNVFVKGRTSEGSGLGLAIVDQIVRAHGGSVMLKPNVGEGTCFVVRLPALSAELIGRPLGKTGGHR